MLCRCDFTHQMLEYTFTEYRRALTYPGPYLLFSYQRQLQHIQAHIHGAIQIMC
ncbi:Uncharacterised protein [Mycobacteroides abscessus]|nr:Uncharacterised protein [Mycobacteroides abscessus]